MGSRMSDVVAVILCLLSDSMIEKLVHLFLEYLNNQHSGIQFSIKIQTDISIPLVILFI